jgi:hypothetical protein
MAKVNNLYPSTPTLPVQGQEQRRENAKDAPEYDQKLLPDGPGAADKPLPDKLRIDEYI